MSNALTTKERVKERLGITETGWDDFINRLIISVTSRMEKMCGRDFTLATYTDELHDGSDWQSSNRNILITRNAPISAVSAISYKAGTNTTPNWTTFSADDYDVDYDAGLIHFSYPLPRGKRNIRTTYTAGWDGYSVAVGGLWELNVTPTGTVDGSNDTFTLPAAASEIIVYADGVRLASSLVTFTAGETEFVIDASAVPVTTIAVDYKSAVDISGDATMPEDLVDVCERAVVHIFKKRESEGRTAESFQESSINWADSIFNAEMLATIKNYRRGYHL
jgi:hypothetical protein